MVMFAVGFYARANPLIACLIVRVQWIPQTVIVITARIRSATDRMGYPLSGMGYPQPIMGHPLPGWDTPWDRTADAALATWLAVCLLHSCRRTVLLLFLSQLCCLD